jgi:nondiscriminating glutamyl-tRNA synthetase
LPGSKEKVRVRFAPSPTGQLHVGGARTAIFNWLFARHSQGAFILRIEDTDIERSSEESERGLIEDLEWLGLEWDEGPGMGGGAGPYRQSERLEDYRRKADELVEAGRAYPCFCEEVVLERKRRQAVKEGKSPQYDGACRDLTQDEIKERRRRGVPEVIRFRVGEGEVHFEDCIRSGIELSTAMVGDFVLLRSNGLPTYNFAAAVDDAAMGVTHVLRGEEHLPNTLRQILLYKALRLKHPVFGHLPLILGEDRSKLSKRHGASSIADLKRSGFLPHAVFNYLSLLGWSHSSEKEVLSKEELVGDFSLERVGRSPAIFDMKKMRWMNGVHIRKHSPEEIFREADAFFPSEIKHQYGAEKRLEILALIQEKIETFSEIGNISSVFSPEVHYEEDALKIFSSEKAREVLSKFADEIAADGEELNCDRAKELIKKVGKKTNAKGKDLYFPIRAALTGNVHGPDLTGVIAVKGRDVVMSLLAKALSLE